MAGEVFLLVFVACFLEAHTQNCGSSAFPGPSIPCPSIEPNSYLPTAMNIRQELPTAEFISNRGPTLPINPFIRIASLESPGDNMALESGVKSSNLPFNFGAPSPACGLTRTSVLESPTRAISTANEAQCSEIKSSSFGPCNPQVSSRIEALDLPPPVSLFGYLPGSISLAESLNLPPLNPFLCLSQSSANVFSDTKANSLAKPLQQFPLNNLVESSLNRLPLLTESSVLDVNSPRYSRPIVPTLCNVPPKLPFSCYGGNSLMSNPFGPNIQTSPVQSSVSIAEASDSNAIGSSTAVSETNTVYRGPNMYRSINNMASPLSSSLSMAEALSSSTESYRGPNAYAFNNIGLNTPIVSSISISEASRCLNSGLNPLLPIVSEISPVNIEPYRRLPSNFCGCLNNHGYFPLQDLSPPGVLSISEAYNPIQQNVGGPFQTINPFSSSLYELSNLIGSVAPLVECVENLSPVRYNPYLYPLQYDPASSSSLSISESNPASQSSLSISEVNQPSILGLSEGLSTSSVAVAESSATGSSFSASETMVSSPEVNLPLTPLTEVSTASTESSSNVLEVSNPVEVENVAIASSVAETSSTSVQTPSSTTVESISSSISTPIAPIFECAPITLAVEIPSSIVPTYSSGFYNGGIRTTGYSSPFAYELQIPSTIPAQLACNLGFVDNYTPVICMNVEHLSC